MITERDRSTAPLWRAAVYARSKEPRAGDARLSCGELDAEGAWSSATAGGRRWIITYRGGGVAAIRC